MSVLENTFSMAELSVATGVNVQTLKTWIHRKLPVASGGNITGGGGPGQRRRFSFFTVMECALVAQMIEVTFGARDVACCFNAARQFAHTGGGGEVFSLPCRIPGLPFHHDHGATIFGVSGDRTFEELWKPGESYDTFGKLRHYLRSDHFLTINASEVFCRVCARLDMHPLVVLDEAYAMEAEAHGEEG